MSSDEVNLLVYAYLADSTLHHSAFTVYNESRLADFVNEEGVNPAPPPSGHLIRLLQKGLLYLQAEAKYRGEDPAGNPPRLIGYVIPDTLPLPPLPKSLPPPVHSPTSSDQSKDQHHHNGEMGRLVTATNSKRKQSIASGSTTAIASTSQRDKSGAISPVNAIAGPSSENKSKRKDTDNPLGDSTPGEDGQPSSSIQQTAKKQRTGASPVIKSPTISTSEGVSTGASSSIANGPIDLTAPGSKNKKGKARAVDAQGDSEMSEAGSSSQPHQNHSTNKGPLARAVAAAAMASSQILPSALTGNSSSKPNTNGVAGSAKDQHTSLSDHSRKSSPSASLLPTLRRSTSPNVVRTTGGGGASSTSTNTFIPPVSKGRPRSTSPSTTLRSSSSSASSSRLANSGPLAPPQPPTLDASGMSSSYENARDPTSLDSARLESAPKQIPRTSIIEDQVMHLKGHTMPVQPCHWNPKVPGLLATG